MDKGGHRYSCMIQGESPDLKCEAAVNRKNAINLVT
jgi:hypothetical protein